MRLRLRTAVLSCALVLFTGIAASLSVSAQSHSHHHADHAMVGSVTVTREGKPMSGASVSLFDQTVTADADGVAAFDHVAFGEQSMLVQQGDTLYTQKVAIDGPHTSIEVTGEARPFDRKLVDNASSAGGSVSALRTAVSVGVGVLVVFVVAGGALAVFRTRKGFVHAMPPRIAGRLLVTALVSATAIGGIAGFLTSYSSGARADSYTYVDTIPQPENVLVIQDDRVATVTWNKQQTFWMNWDDHGDRKLADGSRLGGYFIRWGKKGTGMPAKAYTQFDAIQLQPLEPGAEYELEIHTVDNRGNISRPVSVFTTAVLTAAGAPTEQAAGKNVFRSDSRRVDGFRASMTGFFSDFNKPSGPFDEALWNNAYLAADPRFSGQFINTQFHAHNQVTSGFEDRSANVSRARYIFDFRNREGTIVFDQDGSFSRDQWYLDVVSADSRYMGDIVANGGEKTPVTKMVRIHVDGRVEYPDVDGNFIAIQPTNCSWGPMCGGTQANGGRTGDINISPLPNVREPWVIKMSKPTAGSMRVKVFIRGKLITDANVPLGDRSFDRASVVYTFFSYNTTKGHLIASLNHWDNFGFDGPREQYPGSDQPLVTHNYRTDAAVSMQEDRDNGQRRDIFIPQYNPPAEGKARLHYTLQTGDFWNADSRVILNAGTDTAAEIPLPRPRVDSGQTSRFPLSNGKWGYTEAVAVPVSKLRSGINTIEFRTGNRYVYNVHIELDYPQATGPRFYQPAEIETVRPGYRAVSIPAVSPLGPLVQIHSVGPYSLWNLIHGADGAPKDVTYVEYQNDDPYYKSTWTYTANKPFNKVLKLGYSIDSFTRMVATGTDPGIIRYEFIFDNQPAKPVHIVDTKASVPVTVINEEKSIDISMLCNGKHSLVLRAYNSLGEYKVPFHIYYGPLYFWSTGGSAGNCPSDNSHIASAEPPPSVSVSPTTTVPTATPMPIPTEANPLPTRTPTPPFPGGGTTTPAPTITGTSGGGPSSPQGAADFLQTEGKKLVYRGTEVVLKGTNFDNIGALGANIGSGRVADVYFNGDDYRELASYGANHVRLGLSFKWYKDTPQQFFEEMDRQVGYARANNLWIVFNMFTTPDDCYEGFSKHCSRFWSTPALHDELEAFWEKMAQRYANEPAVAGYDLLNEPFPDGYDCSTWFNVARPIIATVRTAAPNQLIFVGACSDPGNDLRYGNPPTGKNIVYEVHEYSPMGMSHIQPTPTGTLPANYPTPVRYPGDAEEWFGTCYYNKNTFAGTVHPTDIARHSGKNPNPCETADIREHFGLNWASSANVPIYVGEWGAKSMLPGSDAYHRDKAELYRDWKVNHAHYTWKHQTKVTGGVHQWGMYSRPLRKDEPEKIAAVRIAWDGAVRPAFGAAPTGTAPTSAPSTIPSPTPTTVVPTVTPTRTPTPATGVTATPSPVPTSGALTPTVTLTVVPSVTMSPSATLSPTRTPTPIPSGGAGVTVIPSPPVSGAPSLTATPTLTPSIRYSACLRKKEGDADCDDVVGLLDYEYFRAEYTKNRTSTTADFNGDGKVSLLDSEVWTRTFVRQGTR